jgi:hypothetical protein
MSDIDDMPLRDAIITCVLVSNLLKADCPVYPDEFEATLDVLLARIGNEDIIGQLPENCAAFLLSLAARRGSKNE